MKLDTSLHLEVKEDPEKFYAGIVRRQVILIETAPVQEEHTAFVAELQMLQ